MSAGDEATVTVQDAPDEVFDLPPSCKLVWLGLQIHGEATQGELRETTGLPDRTVRYALDRLDDGGCIRKRPSTQDARCTLYRTRE